MSMKLVVLGILMERSSHPYEMQQFIKQREMDQYIKMQKGSLYYTINQLENNGFVEVESVVRDTNHPDKTIYRITETGRKEFHDLLLQQLLQPERVFNPIHETTAFIRHLEKDELIEALKAKINSAEKELSYVINSYKKNETGIPKYGLYIMASGIEFMRIEIAMLKNLLTDVENGSINKKEKLEHFRI